MKLDETLAILDEIGFWDGLDGARDDYVERYRKEMSDEYGIAEDEAYLLLASVDYDTEMIEGTGPADDDDELDLFSYHTLIEHYARGSYGLFQPTDIVDVFDEEAMTHTIGFSLGGKQYEVSFENQEDWASEEAHILINRALVENGSKRQFQILPILDQVIYACLSTPELLDEATARGVIPKPDDLC